MAYAIFSAFETGIIYAIMALGVYLTFRILDFPDLTVDGSFVTGAAVAAISIIAGVPPFLASLYGFVAGFVAGMITGILHTKGKINALLSGILMMIALYSINLRIMGSSNISLMSQETFFKQTQSFTSSTGIDSLLNSMFFFLGLNRSWGIILVMIVITLAIKFLLDFFLKTEVGLALRATGDNQRMIRSFSANTDWLIILGLGLSNGLVAFSGALIAQQGGFADAGMGVGLIIVGLASVIIGEALFGTKTIFRATLAIIGGAIVYRIVVTLALRADFLEAGDVRLITAIIVIAALITPKMIQKNREQKRRKQKRLKQAKEVENHA
ncbi:ABC transporter permease [Alkalihalobacillus alcalophilus ATCC 27647 = CGMCC 1.3604]|uniref:ABC transporter permease n=1 Tax=Alkalihalobacillus alcalophilus ATCC 27647 = CGMCC 1.3604 TaxID=1218173 RepID=J8TGX9_ALKAL|nr:ABC transporter permease [Alkalihalobacillus alcalophilus]AFV25891.1 putative transporter [Alkalihalobacillus alcalophilus ATCC 27647 = CGMCC 1.3604]KGA97397.1 ABC transporter permease [Alkalihalobacillus alcalophilus ATCC 27647 = CGMCC 1.3604]MED1561808.1 ABC transporter permease [Alkalihalobacillus alcalophilus]THG90774.1 ABC transporter permease [Alkalihalobacillus alcalophilus ATCC 27647 = CGMCC 1.3604]